MALTAQQLADLMPDATDVESNEPEIESSLHYAQLALLVACLSWLWRDRQDFFIGANLTVYFSRQQLKNRDFRGSDFFLVKQTQNRPRKSWVVWEEDGKYPDLRGCLKSAERHSNRPLNPPRWGTSEPILVQSPPILGDLGGECRTFATFQTSSNYRIAV
ncbi:Uma2 family endonuclease [Oculatella sp. LEGE 06141]|uniref:Uma2 family endonuclease n=1 Tax=Oculatella sp. LEGE 06141 TaxID=1828648 RepID=UPI001880C169|nr:Uma2 family endonuclease [Oculatella sp. LEGE 06141]